MKRIWKQKWRIRTQYKSLNPQKVARAEFIMKIDSKFSFLNQGTTPAFTKFTVFKLLKMLPLKTRPL